MLGSRWSSMSLEQPLTLVYNTARGTRASSARAEGNGDCCVHHPRAALFGHLFSLPVGFSSDPHQHGQASARSQFEGSSHQRTKGGKRVSQTFSQHVCNSCPSKQPSKERSRKGNERAWRHNAQTSSQESCARVSDFLFLSLPALDAMSCKQSVGR